MEDMAEEGAETLELYLAVAVVEAAQEVRLDRIRGVSPGGFLSLD